MGPANSVVTTDKSGSALVSLSGAELGVTSGGTGSAVVSASAEPSVTSYFLSADTIVSNQAVGTISAGTADPVPGYVQRFAATQSAEKLLCYTHADLSVTTTALCQNEYAADGWGKPANVENLASDICRLPARRDHLSADLASVMGPP